LHIGSVPSYPVVMEACAAVHRARLCTVTLSLLSGRVHLGCLVKHPGTNSRSSRSPNKHPCIHAAAFGRGTSYTATVLRGLWHRHLFLRNCRVPRNYIFRRVPCLAHHRAFCSICMAIQRLLTCVLISLLSSAKLLSDRMCPWPPGASRWRRDLCAERPPTHLATNILPSGYR
jgi:hypothetical protein